MSGGDVSPASTLQRTRDRFAYFLNKRDDLVLKVNNASISRQNLLEQLAHHEAPGTLIPPRELVLVHDMRNVNMENEESLRDAIATLTIDCIRLKFRYDQAKDHIRELTRELLPYQLVTQTRLS
jgi:methyl coenzyme M reductase subunit C-like uncharacterized protein (methanogenesis marker protein 7)